MNSYLARRVRQGRMDIVLTASGVPSDKTGMVLNIADIDKVVRLAEKRGVLHFDTQSPDTYSMCLYNAWLNSSDIVGDSNLHSVEIHDNESQTVWRSESEDKVIYSTKKWEFCASHRLHNPELSAEENIRIYGKCNNANGHGHNFGLEVTFKGKPPLNIESVIDSEVFGRFDHKHLNKDCPELAGIIPTTENFIKVLWTILQKSLGEHNRMAKIRLTETHKNSFEYYG